MALPIIYNIPNAITCDIETIYVQFSETNLQISNEDCNHIKSPKSLPLQSYLVPILKIIAIINGPPLYLFLKSNFRPAEARYQCLQPGCGRSFHTPSGRSKHHRRVHNIGNQTPSQGAPAPSSPGSGAPGLAPGTPGPTAPGLKSSEISVRRWNQSGLFEGQTRLIRPELVDSGSFIGSPRFESTRIDLSETCESGSSGPSDDTNDPDWVHQ